MDSCLAGNGGESVYGDPNYSTNTLNSWGFALLARQEMWSIYVADCVAGDMEIWWWVSLFLEMWRYGDFGGSTGVLGRAQNIGKSAKLQDGVWGYIVIEFKKTRERTKHGGSKPRWSVRSSNRSKSDNLKIPLLNTKINCTQCPHPIFAFASAKVALAVAVAAGCCSGLGKKGKYVFQCQLNHFGW
ncbi:Hypothetical predicted protein [Olea europaea subsp. europaea]|uniref:Uncharacterized protein n=1 Tax=Olea europaea subsp. europaea TaxID=158383 RepID=A0A8S0TTW5_OLEEU|nr:Hypothetical predicted protein [Olea europaea subsp. europaea]